MAYLDSITAVLQLTSAYFSRRKTLSPLGRVTILYNILNLLLALQQCIVILKGHCLLLLFSVVQEATLLTPN